MQSENVRRLAFRLAFAACSAAAAFTVTDASASQCGRASWYAVGSSTASGERMNADALAAAHRTLPFGTQVKVENLANGRSVIVRINDRGPFVAGRVIEVTKAAAQQLGMISAGVANVRVTVVDGAQQLNGCT